jgi:hypothetical protein
MSIPARLVRDRAAAFAVSMGLVPAEAAVSVEWTVASGGNGHGSAEIDTGTGVLTRNAAKVQAKELGGYLSTPTTNAANSWLFWPACFHRTQDFQKMAGSGFHRPGGCYFANDRAEGDLTTIWAFALNRK